jgi:hypothetical protein
MKPEKHNKLVDAARVISDVCNTTECLECPLHDERCIESCVLFDERPYAWELPRKKKAKP